MKNLLVITLVLVVITVQAQTEKFNEVLKANVTNEGLVNYKNLSKNKDKLNDFLSYLKKTSPSKDWSKNKEKAFWINAYNAYTLKLIIDHYPIKSITKIKVEGKSAWKIPFAKVGGTQYTLDQIEHEILRKKFKDPRIHVGVNCASLSCPKLANFAFTEENIETALENLMKEFINDPSRNQLDKPKIRISEIFNWFKEDFTKEGSLIDYINLYASTQLNKKVKISYLSYNWNLNEK